MTKRNVATVFEAKHNIELLYLSLQSKLIAPGIRDITDVLLQVNKQIDTSKNPEALVNRMVNYIRITASSEKLHFSKADEKLIIDLGMIGQQAGLNGQYMADFSDKSQFYSYTDRLELAALIIYQQKRFDTLFSVSNLLINLFSRNNYAFCFKSRSLTNKSSKIPFCTNACHIPGVYFSPRIIADTIALIKL